jgi:phosphoglycerate dehydrogenase-like enzyme
MPIPLVIVTENLDDTAASWISARMRVEQAGPDTAGFETLSTQAEALVIRTYTRVDADLLDRLPRLRVVGRAGVGLDNIDLPECRRRGVEVVHTPEANTQAVSLDRWHELRRDVVAERQMDTLTLGILGLGRVGRRVAEVARAIGFRVLANDLLPMTGESRRSAEPVELETLFAESDVISLHIDGRPTNRGFVDRRLLSLLKPHVTLLNTCRGMVLDHEALGAHLRNHPGSQALLDVHDPEPPTPDHPLWDLPNAHLLPHLASRTRQATENMSWVVKDVVAVLEGRRPRWPAIEPGHPER